MSKISRTKLFKKLGRVGYQSIESATTLCKLRGNPYVELAHWVQQVLQLQDSDLHRIVRAFDLNASQLARQITATLDGLPRGATAISDFSPAILDAIERAWSVASLGYGESLIRSGHVMVALTQDRSLRGQLLQVAAEFERIKPERLQDEFERICEGSPELAAAAAAPDAGGGATSPGVMGQKEALSRYTVDLTAQARSGKMDPIIGRDAEIRQLIDVLMRRRQNNPILTGEAGVGKTAVVEGFAQKIVAGEVPPPLLDVELRALDVGLLQAGAGVKGEFETRLRGVIDEVQASETPIILFVDETHTLVGAGGQAGIGDAANLMKPALARGTLRTIGATTWAEYKKYIEKDPALTRRFQVVQVEEPVEAQCVLIIRSITAAMERHHKVLILEEAIEAAVRLSHRYIPARQLPDKAVSLLDTACARVAVSQHAVPAEVEDSRKKIHALTTELQIIGREKQVGIDVRSRETDARGKLEAEQTRLATLEQRWVEEKSLVDRILRLRQALCAGNESLQTPGGGEAEAAGQRAELSRLQDELAALQKDAPLILPSVDYQAVSAVVAGWTGIPVGRMVRSELAAVMNLSETLAARVIGQKHAHGMIARRVQTSRAGLENPGKPVGVFMLAGTSGVGKTETALALAEALYGGEQNLITINMSEFQEAHTVSTLKGAPPGYVGYGEGGVLTEAVRRRPYSVVLLDEVEKAHPDVHEIFFQVFDKGVMEDGEGRLIDFKNTLILLTTNAGSELIAALCKDPELMPSPEAMAKALREPLLKVFPAALLGRMVIIPYYPLTDATLGHIIRLQLGRVQRRVVENHRVPFSYDDAVVDLIRARCTEMESGGRMIDAILTNTVLPSIGQEVLTRVIEARPLHKVHLKVEGQQFAYEFD